MEVAIEVKSSTRIHGDHLKNLRELKKDFTKIKSLYVVCLEPRPRITEDGIKIVPVDDFVKALWAGQIVTL